MKKVLISIIIPFVLLTASTYFLRQPAHQGMQLKANLQKDILVAKDTLPDDTLPDVSD